MGGGFLIGTLVLLLILAAAALLFMVLWMRRTAAGQTRSDELSVITDRLKESFGALSLEALSRNTSEFIKIANEVLSKQTQANEKDIEGKKKLIDQALEGIRGELQKVHTVVRDLEKDREQKFGELAGQLKNAAQETMKLHETADQLKTALVSTSARGQWGQRIAEDILRLAGFVEGVNYQKERSQLTINTRPDYTFFLPQGLKVNMDVKFPMNNYWRYLETDTESEKGRLKDLFLKDARARIKEVTNREYINPEENTVDYVLVFIPNEQVYGFMNEHDRSLLDDALRNKVILCSPLTLYAILAVIRQAVDNFNLEKTAAHILNLLGSFNKQWEAFMRSFEKLGSKIQEVENEYNVLTTTRRNQLDRQLKRIEELRSQEGITQENPDEALPIADIPAQEKGVNP